MCIRKYCHPATAAVLILLSLCESEIAPVNKCCCHCINIDMLPLLWYECYCHQHAISATTICKCCHLCLNDVTTLCKWFHCYLIGV